MEKNIFFLVSKDGMNKLVEFLKGSITNKTIGEVDEIITILSTSQAIEVVQEQKDHEHVPAIDGASQS